MLSQTWSKECEVEDEARQDEPGVGRWTVVVGPDRTVSCPRLVGTPGWNKRDKKPKPLLDFNLVYVWLCCEMAGKCNDRTTFSCQRFNKRYFDAKNRKSLQITSVGRLKEVNMMIKEIYSLCLTFPRRPGSWTLDWQQRRRRRTLGCHFHGNKIHKLDPTCRIHRS